MSEPLVEADTQFDQTEQGNSEPESTAAPASHNVVQAAGMLAVDRMAHEPAPGPRRYRVSTHSRGLNLRASPEITDNIITSLPRNSIVECSDAQAGFLRVVGPGHQGWAYASYLKLDDPAEKRAAHPQPAHAHGPSSASAAHPSARAKPAKKVHAPASTSPRADRHTAPASSQPGTRQHDELRAGAEQLKSSPAPTATGAKMKVSPALAQMLKTSPLPEDPHTQREIKGQAFVKGAGDASDIDRNDVDQGALGDCYVLAAMAAVARANPEAIRRLIKDNGDGTYNVTLYLKDGIWDAKTPHVVRVDSRFPMQDAGPAYAQTSDKGAQGPELWPLLLEKAYATIRGSYAALEGGLNKHALTQKGNKGSVGLHLLVAGEVETFWTDMNSQKSMVDQIAKALKERRPVTASSSRIALMPSTRALFKDKGLVDGHAYTIHAADPSAMTVSLQNPWGYKHLDNLAMEHFNLMFECYGIGPAL